MSATKNNGHPKAAVGVQGFHLVRRPLGFEIPCVAGYALEASLTLFAIRESRKPQLPQHKLLPPFMQAEPPPFASRSSSAQPYPNPSIRFSDEVTGVDPGMVVLSCATRLVQV